MTDYWIWVVIAVCAAVLYGWRGLGVALSGRLTPRHPAIQWVTYVAYAMLAGTFTRMILLPGGALAGARLDHRLIGCAVALALFYAFRRSAFAGTCAGVAALIGLAYWNPALFSL